MQTFVCSRLIQIKTLFMKPKFELLGTANRNDFIFSLFLISFKHKPFKKLDLNEKHGIAVNYSNNDNRLKKKEEEKR